VLGGGGGRPQTAPPPTATGSRKASGAAKEARGKAKEEVAAEQLDGLARLVELGVAARRAEGEGWPGLRESWGQLPEAAALHLKHLQQQVSESHKVIRALVDVALEEREQKEAALSALADASRRLGKGRGGDLPQERS
jgi:hypothetical protein